MFKINGKCFQLIRNIYENVKSCIMLNGVMSDFWDCNIGAFFASKEHKKYDLWSCQKVTDALIYLLDNIYIRVGYKLY